MVYIFKFNLDYQVVTYDDSVQISTWTWLNQPL